MPANQALDRQILSLANDLTGLAERLHALSDDDIRKEGYLSECAAECRGVLQGVQAFLCDLNHDNC